MDTQTPHVAADAAAIDAKFAALRADIKSELTEFECRFMQRLLELEHNHQLAQLQSECRRQELIIEIDGRHQLGMLEMGARVQEGLAVLRAQFETTLPTLATKVDLIEHNAAKRA